MQNKQDAEMAQFKARNIYRFNPKAWDFNKWFNNSYRQYIVEYKGDNNLEDNLNSTFEALMTEDTPESNSNNVNTT